MVTTLFFMWAFLTELNDIMIPHLQSIFDLNYTESMMVQLVFFTGYFIFAVPSGKVVEWVGYKRTMVLGLSIMAAGSLLMLPAASAASFSLFLGAEFVLAAGITALQVAANPYVSILGPPSGRRDRRPPWSRTGARERRPDRGSRSHPGSRPASRGGALSVERQLADPSRRSSLPARPS